MLPRHGIRVRISETGEGDPVVIVPGNTGDGFPFIPLLPHLRGRRVITINRPGACEIKSWSRYNGPFGSNALFGAG
jgi:hypothetical protein